MIRNIMKYIFPFIPINIAAIIPSDEIYPDTHGLPSGNLT